MTPQALINEGKLGEALAALQNQVRNDPADAKQRIFLFQLLAVMGQWSRALTQLNVVGELDSAALPMVQTYREAIQCEALREEIFSAARLPQFFDRPLPWLTQLARALKFDSFPNTPRAAAIREQAFEQAPACSGSINGERFKWIADADPRLGPVIEAIIDGNYFWVPMEHISRVDLAAPTDLRDIVFTTASFTWRSGEQSAGLIPSRYSDTLKRNKDALLLSRRTEWDEQSGGCLGQRLFVTDAGEYPLLDTRVIEFDAPAENEQHG